MPNINKQPRDMNGDPHGEWIGYHTNGQLMYSDNYVHGVEHGLIVGYFSDGTLRFRGYRNMGREIGYWNWYDKKYYYLWLI